MKRLVLSFKYAISGIWFCIKSSRNFRIHTVAAAYMLYFARFFDFGKNEKVLLFLVIASVISLEGINSAIEQLCNSITTEKCRWIRQAKDAAAGMVLIAAICAVASAVVLFSDISAIRAVFVYFSVIPRLLMLVLSALCSVLYIFYEDIFLNGKKRD